ncbi:hypothetical protein, partial [Escherichia coli]|uniref:hypothetical protein n=1 Tax=Escherichia coli TaxID=562 RepID=UPI00197A950C
FWHKPTMGWFVLAASARNALNLIFAIVCHGFGSALSATGNRLGRTPDPHCCNINGLRPPTS